MQICSNGHQITSSYHKHPDDRKTFCPDCGAGTVHECPTCGLEIKGQYYDEHEEPQLSAKQITTPKFCEKCGSAFPWLSALPPNLHSIDDIENICRRFDLIVAQLRFRRENRSTLTVTDEYDVQDLMDALLRIYFDDIRKEEWTPSYAGKSARMDFLLKDHSIVIETKMTREGLSDGQVGDQLAVDIERYKQHANCKALVCFVYDPERQLKNPTGIERDLSGTRDKLSVRVIVMPKGF